MKKTFARLLALTMAMLITVSVAQPVFATGGAPPEETISSGAAPEPVEEIPSEPKELPIDSTSVETEAIQTETEETQQTEPLEIEIPTETTLPTEPATEPVTEEPSAPPTEPVQTEPLTVPPATEPTDPEPSEPAALPETEPESMPDAELTPIPMMELMMATPYAEHPELVNLGSYQILVRNGGTANLDPYSPGMFLSSINRMTLKNLDGSVSYAFCIQPGTPTANYYKQDPTLNPWTRLSDGQRNAMGVTLSYGFPKTYHHDGFPGSPGKAPAMGGSLEEWKTSERYAATQIIIWEILRGERSETPPYAKKAAISNPTLAYFVGNSNVEWFNLLAEYKALDKILSNFGIIPSFAYDSIDSANDDKHRLKFDEDSKTYQLVLEDANNVLTLRTPTANNPQIMHSFEFHADGLTIVRNDNTLTITAPESMKEKLENPDGVLVSCSGYTNINTLGNNCIVWANVTDPNGKQSFITHRESVQASPYCCFKVYAEHKYEKGFIEIHKQDANTDMDLSGAEFKAVNTETMKPYYIGPTNDQGYALSEALPLGTYTITETKAPNGYQINRLIPEVVVTDQNTTTQTAYKLTVKDQPDTVPLNIRKTTNTGANLGGWKFNIYSDSGCSVLVKGDLESQNDGTISVSLAPGTYWVKEVGDTQGRWGSPEWVCDTNKKSVTLTAGKTGSVTFSNTQRPGKISIHKVDPGNQPLAGATFLLEWSDGAA